jgi:hypothetical protein
MNPNRMFQSTPVIKLGDAFKKVANFQKRFKTIPSLLEVDHLTVAGDVSFGRGVVLRGTVIIVANDGQAIELPDGTTLENKLVSGASCLPCLLSLPFILPRVLTSFLSHRFPQAYRPLNASRRKSMSSFPLPFCF